MNHIEFIEKNVREELLRQGFTQAVAQGGHTRRSICTSGCHRQAEKGECLTHVMRHAKLWAEKQTSAAERREAKRKVRKGGDQAGLF